MITFISHENYPEDQYIKEIVYIQIDPAAQLAYVRKPMKNGGLFWSPMSCAVMKNGAKKYINSIEIDSNSFKKEILEFLEARIWEKKAPHQNVHHANTLPLKYENAPTPAAQMSFLDECPF